MNYFDLSQLLSNPRMTANEKISAIRNKSKMDANWCQWIGKHLLFQIEHNNFTKKEIGDILMICGKVDYSIMRDFFELKLEFPIMKNMLLKGCFLSSRRNEQWIIFNQIAIQEIYKELRYTQEENRKIREIICNQQLVHISIPLLQLLPAYCVVEILEYISHIQYINYRFISQLICGVESSMRKIGKGSYIQNFD